MVILFIFYLHIAGSIIAFTKNWQDDGLSGGFMVLGFIGLIFAITWTLVSFILHYVAPGGIPKIIDQDTLSVLSLGIVELFIYYFFFFKKPAHNTSK